MEVFFASLNVTHMVLQIFDVCILMRLVWGDYASLLILTSDLTNLFHTSVTRYF